MNLICFPHYTCGGLLCDILSGTFSDVHQVTRGLNSFNHSIGNIGDSDSIFEDYDQEEFLKKLSTIKSDKNVYIGTHCWPGKLDINKFNRVICITTMTNRSRVYRWARAFYHYYNRSEPWQLVGIDLIDKQRETAKNYIKPFKPVDDTINIEFSDIVENTLAFQKLVEDCDYIKSLSRWKEINNFLYHDNFWNSTPVQRYHEAEYELALNQRYAYE